MAEGNCTRISLHETLDILHLPPRCTTASVTESPRPPEGHQKLGTYAVVILTVTPILITAVIVFLAFLWFGKENEYCLAHIHDQGVANQSNRPVRSCSSSSHWSPGRSRSGYACSHIIGIFWCAVDSCSGNFYDQIGQPQPLCSTSLILSAWPINTWRFFDHSCTQRLNALYAFLTVTLFTTATLLQFGSTALLADLTLGSISGLPQVSQRNIDFAYEPILTQSALVARQLWSNSSTNDTDSRPSGLYDIPLIRHRSSWSKNPTNYPTFAELNSPAPLRDDIDDTGRLLRAFLPMVESQQRQKLQRYAGKALIMDARVACQRPFFNNLTAASDFATGAVALFGALKNSTTSPELLTVNGSTGFLCHTYLVSDGPTICQLGGGSPEFVDDSAGGLQSEFRPRTNSEVATTGAAYLMINSTIDYKGLIDVVIKDHVFEHDLDYGPWSRWLIRAGGSVVVNSSFTLCYAAWDFARLNVSLHSNVLRSEPLPRYDSKSGVFTFEEVLLQLGNDADHTENRDRGILTLDERPSWVPTDADTIRPIYSRPWIRGYMDMNEVVPSWSALMSQNIGTGNMSAIMFDAAFDGVPNVSIIIPDPTIITLFTQALQGGSVARAMSSIFTVLASNAYYDQFQQFQFNHATQETYFETVLLPQSHRGFTGITCTVVVHLLVVAMITILFLWQTKMTMLGNNWQNIAQITAPLTEHILSASSLESDKDVAARLGKDDTLRKRVILGFTVDSAGRQRCGLISAKGGETRCEGPCDEK